MAIQMAIPNRPFATEPLTGLMMPDGIFEIAFGKQRINAHFTNNGPTPIANVQFYIESVSHPGIVITPATFSLGSAQSNVSYLYGWDADFSACAPGTHFISFIAESPAGKKRMIKKIFVTQITFNTSDASFTIAYPEGSMQVVFQDFIGPKDGGCCCKGEKEPKDENPKNGRDPRDPTGPSNVINIFDAFRKEAERGQRPDFKFCSPYYLPHKVSMYITPSPSYEGQYSDLPFQDPWWKVLLCIVVLALLIAAAIVSATSGSGTITVTGGGGGSGGASGSSCCGVGASGGSSSYIAAGLVAAAAVVAGIAAASDVRDPLRRGQDNTMPRAGELTIEESLQTTFSYPEAIVPGKAFSAGLKWEYTRRTTGNTYNYSADDVMQNIHVLSRYEIDAVDVIRVYKRERFVVKASFFDTNGKQMSGNSLFVQCFLVGPQGQSRKFLLQDHGDGDDVTANDGVYSGGTFFSTNDGGLWTYYVLAQDINNAQPDLKPEEAAQIIGGMLLTNQLTLSFDQDTCQFVPDGHVNVIVGN